KQNLTDNDLVGTYYGYDGASRLAQMQLLDSPQRATYFAYDNSGLVLTRALPVNPTSSNQQIGYYTYDNVGRLQSIKHWSSALGVSILGLYYTRDQNGNITYFQETSSASTVGFDQGTTYYAWDALDRMTKDERRDSGGNLEYGFLYNYDPVGNRYFKYDYTVPAAINTTYYVYDPRNVLTTEWKVQ